MYEVVSHSFKFYSISTPQCALEAGYSYSLGDMEKQGNGAVYPYLAVQHYSRLLSNELFFNTGVYLLVWAAAFKTPVEINYLVLH